MTLDMWAGHKFLQVIGIPLGNQLPGRSMLLFQDLTQLHRLEIVRKDFMSNISHELRTPLASLKALSETLLESALEDPPAARRFIVRMDTEVDNLTFLVNELLELSRIEAGRVNFEFQRIHPCDLMIKPYERMLLPAERAGLSMSFGMQPGFTTGICRPGSHRAGVYQYAAQRDKIHPPGGVSAWAAGSMKTWWSSWCAILARAFRKRTLSASLSVFIKWTGRVPGAEPA